MTSVMSALLSITLVVSASAVSYTISDKANMNARRSIVRKDAAQTLSFLPEPKGSFTSCTDSGTDQVSHQPNAAPQSACAARLSGFDGSVVGTHLVDCQCKRIAIISGGTTDALQPADQKNEFTCCHQVHKHGNDDLCAAECFLDDAAIAAHAATHEAAQDEETRQHAAEETCTTAADKTCAKLAGKCGPLKIVGADKCATACAGDCGADDDADEAADKETCCEAAPAPATTAAPVAATCADFVAAGVACPAATPTAEATTKECAGATCAPGDCCKA